MASRPRDTKKRGWPDGLYERNGYFSWRNPLTGKEMGIGRVPVGIAKAQAAEANIAVHGLRDRPRLVDRLEGRDDSTLGAWLDQFEANLAERDLKTQTRRQYKSNLKLARETLAPALGLPIVRADTRLFADAISKVAKSISPRTGKPREQTAKSMRSMLVDCFDSAITAGWVKENPVRITEGPKVKIRRARLTWEVFQKLYASLPPGRLKNAVTLALVSGQSRETVSAGKFAQLLDVPRPGLSPQECWCVRRGKTGAMIAIPLDLRLNAFGMSLRDVVKQCRSTGVASKHLVHNTSRAEGKVGSYMPCNAMSDRFTEAVDALGLDWGDKTPPTFHELRSLSKRLYKAQGGVNTIDLLGHQDEATGELYADARGAEYKVVALG